MNNQFGKLNFGKCSQTLNGKKPDTKLNECIKCILKQNQRINNAS